MAIEKNNPATPIAGTDEMPEEDLSISIDNPDSVSVETDDGGLLIDFNPESEKLMAEDFGSNLADYMSEDNLSKLGTELTVSYTHLTLPTILLV